LFIIPRDDVGAKEGISFLEDFEGAEELVSSHFFSDSRAGPCEDEKKQNGKDVFHDGIEKAKRKNKYLN